MTKESNHLAISKEDKAIREEIRGLQDKKNKDLKKLSTKEAKCIKAIDNPKKKYQSKTKFIKEHFATVMKVAEHLHYIHSKHLYRLDYNTFEEYLQEEFSYTRSRGYQLIDANKLAEDINKEIGNEILTSEPQCRELLRLRIYEGLDHQKVDKDKTNEARLELIKKLSKESDTIKTSVLAEEVDKILEAEKQKQIKDVKYYTGSFNSTYKGVTRVLENIFADEKLNAVDQKKIRSNAIEKLEELLETLKKDNT